MASLTGWFYRRLNLLKNMCNLTKAYLHIYIYIAKCAFIYSCLYGYMNIYKLKSHNSLK